MAIQLLGPWHIPHVCLPPAPAASVGPWWLDQQGSNLLTDTMQACFLQALIPMCALASLAKKLEAKRQNGGQWVETCDLEQLYCQSNIPSNQWSRLTNLLEKLAIVTAVRP